LYAGNACLGFAGQIDPRVAEQSDLSSETVLAEIWLEPAYEARAAELAVSEVSRFPAVRRDIAVLVRKDVQYADVFGVIAEAVGGVLERQWLFDVFEGKGIPEGSHSLGIALLLRKLDGTFTDEEANRVRETAVKVLESLGATAR
jgi:phenylalanyl-tRNA synthetase beta chain